LSILKPDSCIVIPLSTTLNGLQFYMKQALQCIIMHSDIVLFTDFKRFEANGSDLSFELQRQIYISVLNVI